MGGVKRAVSRGNVTQWVILGLAFIFLSGLWLFNHPALFAGFSNDVSFTNANHPPSDWRIFDSKELGISVLYPPSYIPDSSYVYTELGPRSGIKGVKFTIPDSYTTGTNLSHSDTGVSIEVLPGDDTCAGTSFVEEGLASTTLTEEGITYSIVKTAGAGAGNFYEETVYVITGSTPCTAVRYFIHSTNIGNYEPGTVTAFDKQALLKEFDMVRRSLILTR